MPGLYWHEVLWRTLRNRRFQNTCILIALFVFVAALGYFVGAVT